MNEMVLKEFEGHAIRSRLDEEGNPWFVSQDVMEILDLKNQRHALRKLDDDQRGELELPGNAGFRKFSAVNESGLYGLVLMSKKPGAKKFQKWITSVVLPSLRKTGSYTMVQTYVEMSPIERLKAELAHMERVEASLHQQKLVNDRMATEMLVIAHEAKQENDTLTHDQISELDQEISKKWHASKAHVKICGLLKKAIKAHFFEIKGTRTYKEIPRSGFDKALQIVRDFKVPEYLVSENYLNKSSLEANKEQP